MTLPLYLPGSRVDRIFRITALLSALLIPAVLIAFLVQLGLGSAPAWREFGIGFLFGTDWDPVADRYGALPAIVGTLLTTAIALLISIPPAFVTALFLVDAPPAVGAGVGQRRHPPAAGPRVV